MGEKKRPQTPGQARAAVRKRRRKEERAREDAARAGEQGVPLEQLRKAECLATLTQIKVPEWLRSQPTYW